MQHFHPFHLTVFFLVLFCEAVFSSETPEAGDLVDVGNLRKELESEQEESAIPPELRDIVERFTPFEFQHDDSQDSRVTLPYRLYIPPNLVAGKKYPLVLWLHGREVAGSDNWRQLTHMQKALHKHKDAYPAFILVPQIDSDDSWFEQQEKAKVVDNLAVVRSLSEKIIREYPIDIKGVSLIGISTGGTACWEMGSRYPSLFCAIAPLSSDGGENSKTHLLGSTPIWVFHNTYDVESSIEKVRHTAHAIEDAGGKIVLTEFERNNHDSWNPAFYDRHLFSWLVNRRQGDWTWRPKEEQRKWLKTSVLPTVLIIGLIVLVLSSVIGEFRRRKKTEAPKIPTSGF